MNKTELISNLSQRIALPKTTCSKIINTALNCIVERLASGERVTLSNFGAFSISEKTARTGMNPRTQERITIPPHRVVKFRAGNEFESLLNPGE